MKTDLNWYVVYTMPKGERKVASSLANLGVESYLPLHYVIRRWSDRMKKLEVPLFPNYVFVKMDRAMRKHAFAIREFVKFVSIDKDPVVVRESEILTIKKILNETNTDIMPEDYFQNGMKIRIEHGQFAGVEGIIVGKSNSARLIVKVEGLMKAFSFNVPAHLAHAVLS